MFSFLSTFALLLNRWGFQSSLVDRPQLFLSIKDVNINFMSISDVHARVKKPQNSSYGCSGDKMMVKLMADSADKLVGQRIQARRKEAGLTAADLAETIDISQQQLSRYERGTNKINIAHLVKIAVALKTPISWFFIDCMEDLNVSDIPINYATGLDVELKQRLEQVWNKLDNTKRKSLIMFLDEFIK
ncbi:TPA: helix-turn-helix domain-containing protein [Escherichia coli]